MDLTNRLRRISIALFVVFGIIITSRTFAEVVCQPLIYAKPHQVVPDRHARGILWKITAPGLRPSYLMGTVHVGEESVVNLPAAITRYLDSADSLTLEIRFDKDAELESALDMFYRDGSRIEDEIGTDLYHMVTPLLTKYGVTREAAANLKPWAAFLILNMPPQFHNKPPLDAVLMQRAQKQGIDVYGLETTREQMSLFSTIKRQEQIDLLRDTVCHYDAIQSDIREAIDLYLNRDLRGLASMAEKYAFYKDDRYEKFMNRFLVERNKTMTDRMQVRLHEGNAFIAVGALHLPGEEGIIGLLERRGYGLAAVY